MTATLALAGDTMLGRGVADVLRADPHAPLVSPEVAEHLGRADCLILNLECCISDRGAPFPDPDKPFFFRAPPLAAERLAELGVDAVTLANNHALDYGADALLDTLSLLKAAGLGTVGAGQNEEAARTPYRLRCGGLTLRLVAFCDHPAAFAAGPDRPGVAFADLTSGLPRWVCEAASGDADRGETVVVTPHWGPNMVLEPLPEVRRAADELLVAGATLVAGHSAHVFQGAARRVLFDLGDFLDDYAVDRQLRNDLGLLWFVELESGMPRTIQALPLGLDYCFTRVASPEESQWIMRRLVALCAPFGTEVRFADGLIDLDAGS
jgi:poly-gamma-glutamate capsule biosynthesis protein CapA/YwtB (metallophosphatase superfamily)